VHPHGLDPLQRRHLLAVEGQLQDVRRLRMARQLGVPRLVAPRPERRRPIHPDQEVGAAAPAVPHQHRLVDHVGAVAHGRLRRRGGLGPVEVAAGVRDRRDAQPLLPERRELPLLVQLALGGEQVGLRRSALFELAPPRHLQVQLREVLALQEVVEVGRRIDDLIGVLLHALAMTSRTLVIQLIREMRQHRPPVRDLAVVQPRSGRSASRLFLGGRRLLLTAVAHRIIRRPVSSTGRLLRQKTGKTAHAGVTVAAVVAGAGHLHLLHRHHRRRP
jgi:hypothetical protein